MAQKNRKLIVLDGKTIKTEAALHNFLKSELGFPDYYGMNLDALWDCITGHIALPIKIVWKNVKHSEQMLGKQFVDALIKLFTDAKKDLGQEFDYELKQ